MFRQDFSFPACYQAHHLPVVCCLSQCLQFLARNKIKFKDWITSTQSVLFCPTNSISLSKMSSAHIWTRGFSIIIFSHKYLKTLGLPPLSAPKARIYLQRNALSPLLVEDIIPFLEPPSTELVWLKWFYF